MTEKPMLQNFLDPIAKVWCIPDVSYPEVRHRRQELRHKKKDSKKVTR